MTRSIQAGLLAGAAAACLWSFACTGSAECAATDPTCGVIVEHEGPIVSNAVQQPMSPMFTRSSLAQTVPGEANAWVSLLPGTSPGGERAIITNLDQLYSVQTTVVDGGVDPVPIPAHTGDTIEIVVTDATGAELLRTSIGVRLRRPPVVVRTNPPRGKTSVPLNNIMVVVFSEPISPVTVTSSAVRLFRGTSPVAGAARLLEGTSTTLVFEPSAALAANTGYRFVASGEIADLDGDRLGTDFIVDFTTGTSILGAVSSVRVEPSTASMPLGTQLSLSVVPRDGTGSRVSGRPVAWSSDDPLVASVSAEGLVSTHAEGFARIRAEVDGGVGTASVEVYALRVTAVTTGAAPAMGFPLWVWRGTHELFGPPSGFQLPANGTVPLVGLGAGGYTLQIAELPANCDVVERSHVVSFAGPMEVRFDFTCFAPAQIALASTEDGDAEIYVINADGTGRTRLTSHPAMDREPAWSPDGAQIAFVSDRDGDAEIWVMNADGSNPVRLTDAPGEDRRPAWSPDGSRIAFASDRGGNFDIYAMNVDGTGLVRLTNEAAEERDPAWSPDGSRIVFTRAGGLHVMHADGSAVVPITQPSGERDMEPAWSPNGARVAFTRVDDAGRNVWVVDADGSGAVKWTTQWCGGCDAEAAEKPAWSPDGRGMLAFAAAGYGIADQKSVLIVREHEQQPSLLTVGFDPAWRPKMSAPEE